MKKEWAYVPECLYRSGNSSSPKLDHVRINRGPDKDDDIATTVINGITYVYPNTGGISVFNTPDYTLSKKWWICYANVILPSKLILVHDSTAFNGCKHFTISPKYFMTLDEYKKQLINFEKCFQKHFM
ncbi:MAG: hypothetical protein VSS75_008765 [Candidatus Parabeggiatoa sp.]|nr:hypothetical protein [Candidatus Parabeggiatoa sp.]